MSVNINSKYEHEVYYTTNRTFIHIAVRMIQGEDGIIKIIARTPDSSTVRKIRNDTYMLMKALGNYIGLKCPHLKDFTAVDFIMWLNHVEAYLRIVHQPSKQHMDSFFETANLVFLYMMFRNYTYKNIQNVDMLRSIVMQILYTSFSYVGEEISYPLKPFVLHYENRFFWDGCLDIINKKSRDMMRLHVDSAFYNKMFSELVLYSSI